MKKVLLSILGILLASTSLHSQAQATTYYVSKSGSDSNDCGTATNPNGSSPKLTIRNAINNCAGPGHTIQIRQGDYFEGLSNSTGAGNFTNWPRGSSWSLGGFFTLESYPGEMATIHNSSLSYNALDIHFRNMAGNQVEPQYIVFNRLDLNGDGVGDCGTCIGAPVLYWSAPHLKVLNSKLHNVNQQIVSGGDASCLRSTCNPIQPITADDMTLENNEIYDAWIYYESGEIFLSSGGAYCGYFAPVNSIIKNNYIHHCRGYALHFYHGQDQTAIHDNLIEGNTITDCATSGGDYDRSLSCLVDYGHDDLFINNLFYNLGRGYAHVEAAMTIHGVNHRFYNNTIYGSDGHGFLLYPEAAGNVFRGNIVYDTLKSPSIYSLAPASSNTTVDNLTSNPLVISTDTPDAYHLSSGSPARGACPNFSSTFGIDKDRVVRPSSGNWDCGVYQFGGTVIIPVSDIPTPRNLRVLANSP